jgi:hypothetical protein
MRKKSYSAPCIQQEEVILEAGIATSAGVEIIIPEEWEEGNTDWW